MTVTAHDDLSTLVAHCKINGIVTTQIGIVNARHLSLYKTHGLNNI